jgi:uncharacterized protein YbbK (DUF523 family)
LASGTKAVTGPGIAVCQSMRQGIKRVPRPRQNIIGTIMGYWTILSAADDKVTPNGVKRVLVAKCRCGTIRSVLEQNVLSGKSKSCGCQQRIKAREYQNQIWAKRKATKE